MRRDLRFTLVGIVTAASRMTKGWTSMYTHIRKGAQVFANKYSNNRKTIDEVVFGKK